MNNEMKEKINDYIKKVKTSIPEISIYDFNYIHFHGIPGFNFEIAEKIMDKEKVIAGIEYQNNALKMFVFGSKNIKNTIETLLYSIYTESFPEYRFNRAKENSKRKECFYSISIKTSLEIEKNYNVIKEHYLKYKQILEINDFISIKK